MVLFIYEFCVSRAFRPGVGVMASQRGGVELCPNTGEYNELGFGNVWLSKIAGAICTTRVLQPQQVMKGAPSELK